MAPSRNPKLVPGSLSQHVFQDGVGNFSVRSRSDVENYRVVVSTCASAAIVDGIGIRLGHFSHVFIDEAGQCLEPEVSLLSRLGTQSEPRNCANSWPSQSERSQARTQISFSPETLNNWGQSFGLGSRLNSAFLAARLID